MLKIFSQGCRRGGFWAGKGLAGGRVPSFQATSLFGSVGGCLQKKLCFGVATLWRSLVGGSLFRHCGNCTWTIALPPVAPSTAVWEEIKTNEHKKNTRNRVCTLTRNWCTWFKRCSFSFRIILCIFFGLKTIKKKGIKSQNEQQNFLT